jgi:hypothetical protein
VGSREEVAALLTLSELAFACYVYAGVSNYDESYLRFRRVTGSSPDLLKAEHRRAVLKWLREWGCRQFNREDQDHASAQILEWYEEFGSSLFAGHVELPRLGDTELVRVGEAYDRLSNMIAGHRRRAHSTHAVSIGPTGAAKILFAIRPHALPPWDDAIRRAFGYDRSPKAYLSFFRHVRSLLDDLAKSCEREGFELADLPRKLGRPHSTLPKLIDEYYWVTITRGCKPPDPHTLQRWGSWG